MKYLLWSIPIVLIIVYFGGYYFIGNRISIHSEGIWRIWAPLVSLEVGYEAKRISKWFGGEWISEDGEKLVITFPESQSVPGGQNMRIESPALPQFEREGFWGISRNPTALRYGSIQLNVSISDTESLWLGASRDTLSIHRFTSLYPSDASKPTTPAPFDPTVFTRRTPAIEAE